MINLKENNVTFNKRRIFRVHDSFSPDQQSVARINPVRSELLIILWEVLAEPQSIAGHGFENHYEKSRPETLDTLIRRFRRHGKRIAFGLRSDQAVFNHYVSGARGEAVIYGLKKKIKIKTPYLYNAPDTRVRTRRKISSCQNSDNVCKIYQRSVYPEFKQ